MFVTKEDEIRATLRVSQDEFQPSIKEFIFYRLLLISPSYWKVSNIIKAGLGAAARKQASEDELLVFKLYKKAGDVYAYPFEEWWEQYGFKLFKREVPKSINIDIPLDSEKSAGELQAEAKKAISLWMTVKEISDEAEYELLQSGPHIPELVRKLGMLEAKVYIEGTYKSKIDQWRLAIAFGFNKNRLESKHLSSDCETSEIPKPERKYLSEQMRRELVELLSLSENAARGIFPSVAKSESHLKFDDIPLFGVLSQSRKLDVELSERDKVYRRTTGSRHLGRLPSITRFKVLNELEKRELNWREIVDEVFSTAEKLLKK